MNGEFDQRPETNPYKYTEGVFEAGDDGSDFTVGAVDRGGEMGNYFVGQIGGLAIFDRALAPNEIRLIHSEYPLNNHRIS